MLDSLLTLAGIVAVACSLVATLLWVVPVLVRKAADPFIVLKDQLKDLVSKLSKKEDKAE